MSRYRDFRFVARALGAIGGRALAADLARFRRPSDPWEGVIQLASRELVTPALHRGLLASGFLVDAPSDVVDYLKAVDQLNGERNRAIVDQVVELVTELAGVGSRPMLLKGAAYLLDPFYPDAIDRIVGDIDVLIDPRSIEAAVQALHAIGYRRHEGDAHREEHHHYPSLVRDGSVAAVELHIRPVLTPYARLQSGERMIRAGRGMELHGRRVVLPSLRDTVILNVIHGQLGHRQYWRGSSSLRELSDLARLRAAAEDRIDWREVASTFDQAGLGAALRTHLALVERLLDQPLPGDLKPGWAAWFGWRRALLQRRSVVLNRVGGKYGRHRAAFVEARALRWARGSDRRVG